MKRSKNVMEAYQIDSRKFGGRFVATRSFSSNEVICSGKRPEAVFRRAKALGVEEPVINYIQEAGADRLH